MFPTTGFIWSKPLEQEYGVISLPLDVTDIDNIKTVLKKVEEITGGRLDVLYNNAGISISGPAIEIDETQLNKVFQVNVIGQINMTKYFAPLIINAKELFFSQVLLQLEFP